MLCRNLFFLKSNQYSRSVSDRSWYIFVCCISLFAIKFTPHFNILKFLARSQFRQILKLPFFPVFTILSATFVLYFQTTYYRHVAGAGDGSGSPLPRGQPGPPYPPASHTAGEQAETFPAQSCVCHMFPKMYLKSIRSSRKPGTKMSYITQEHPASCTCHTESSTCVYT